MCHVTKRARLLLGLLILGAGVGADQATKRLAVERLRGAPPVSFLADTVRLQYAENTGAFLGLGKALSARQRFWAFTVATAALLAGLGIFLALHWDTHRLSFVALAMVLAGGVGNLLDRLFHDGRVIDFLNLGIGPLRTGIFNVADVGITAGVVLLWIGTLRTRRGPQTGSAA